MSLKNIFVTGADGFIGSHLVETLTKNGHNVRALCQYNSFGHKGWLDDLHPSVVDNIDAHFGDIRDAEFLSTLMNGCDIVFHLAALIAIPFSYHSPHSYVETNVVGTLNLLQAAKRHEVEKFIHTSTSEVYGTAQFVPITEAHPLQGQSPYSASKIGADQIAHSFFTSFKTPVTIIRPFNTYGPRQSSRALIPAIITQLLGEERRLKLGKITPTRDFNYITDTVNGFLATIDANKIEGETINLGSNFEISVENVARYICEIMGIDVVIEADDQRFRPPQSEVDRLWACNTKAKELLSWSPQYAGTEGFKKGLQKTIEWFSEQKNLDKYPKTGYTL